MDDRWTAHLMRRAGFGLSPADRVVTLVFSEFGRRPTENGGGGTDHGTAGPVFLLGNQVRPGLHGRQPSLENLVGGNLQHTVDFRRVYAGVLEGWLNGSSTLKNQKPLPLVERSLG